jgi:hypothetical protein
MASRRRVRNLLVMGAAAVVAGAAAIVLAGPAAAAELVTNGGFETGNLSSWACTGGTGSVVTSPVRSGSYALAGAATANDNAQCTQTTTSASPAARAPGPRRPPRGRSSR